MYEVYIKFHCLAFTYEVSIGSDKKLIKRFRQIAKSD